MYMTKSKIDNADLYDSNNQIKVIWEDTLDNHSTHKEKQVEKYFQNKYKTNKVKVIFKPITTKNSDVVAEGTADASEVILDENYQKQLIESYLKDNKVEIPMDYLMKLDNSVNVELEDYKEQTNRYKKFKIKQIQFSNFLSFGDHNKIDFTDKLGITSVMSNPPNFGGKTTMTVDLLLFLFFGVTSKTEKMEEVFNRFSGEDTVSVKGMVEIEGDNYIISRKINRKQGKGGEYTCKSELDFYQVLPKGGVKQLNGEQRKFTDDLIKTYVGSYDDFLITILTTGDNLDDLIKTKPTERGRILTKFIGLEFFREKEKIAKKKHQEWKETSKLYHNNSQDILGRIDTENTKIKDNQEFIASLDITLKAKIELLKEFDAERDRLNGIRINNIDTEMYKLDEQAIQSGIDKVKLMIDAKKTEIEDLRKDNPTPENQFDVDTYSTKVTDLREAKEKEIELKLEIGQIERTISNLKDGEICQSCKRPLEGVDHKKEIADNEKKLKSKNTEHKKVLKSIEDLTAVIATYEKLKELWDQYNKAELLLQNKEMELVNFNGSLERGQEKLKQYYLAKEALETNKIIDTDLQKLKFKTENETNDKDSLMLQINSIKKDIELSESKIADYNNLITELKREEVVDKIFKVYLDVYGKNGISKMVLGTMIPLINSHLKILLSDTCDFDLVMRMNEKSEIEFWMVDCESGIEKPLSSGSGYEKTVSSLALRCVLSKVCSLPKPNIIIFDEVTGKVSNDNLDRLGMFFEKLKSLFEHIWVISHNPYVQDWADNIVRVEKTDNISKVVEVNE
jgi:DNA repair exonuclease SbcCD ATPase subunit